MTETDPFDWGPLGEAWWLETAAQLGASDLQTKFACAKHRGCSNTEAARQAGYEADSDGMRSAGYRAMRSNSVERLLAFAASEGGGYGGEVDRDEAKRILSSLARGSDPRVRISAVEQLNKMAEADRQQQDAEDEPTPKEALAELAALSPEIAAHLAAETGAPLDWLPTEVLVRGTAHLEQLAGNWIRDNPARAIELARYWLQPSSGTNVNQLTNGKGATQ